MASFTDGHKVAHKLPKLTPALNARINGIGSAKTDDETCRSMYDIMVDIMGEDAAAQAFDGSTYDAVDVMEVATCFARMCRAYRQPLADEQAAQATRALNQLPVDKLASLNSIVSQA